MTQPDAPPETTDTETVTAETEAALSLLSASAVREAANTILETGLSGNLEHFSVHPEKLAAAADYVLEVTREAYPDGQIPFHARWRHIEAGGIDRWGGIAAARQWSMREEFGRAAYDLAVISVLLDAGAGADWRYTEAQSGLEFTRSEGLGVASVDLFCSGRLSSVPADPFRVDAEALMGFTADDLAEAFQVSPGNVLEGLEGRAALLRRLGEHIATDPEFFALEDEPRPSGLFDLFLSEAENGTVAAPVILERVLEGLGPVWPARLDLGGIPLGDTWHYPWLRRDGAADGLVPFHKLSQWLSYSLIEPLQWCGIEVTNIDGLTGLAEYRNGGLFLDAGVLSLRNADAAGHAHETGSTLIVEWRALTVALLDRLAALIREKTGTNADEMPLACILEGGTWSAGRKLAHEKRDGEPPIRIVSDGTVF